MDFKLLAGKYKSIDIFEWNNIPELAIITGKNGSGKTQLLELMNWHFTPAENKRQINKDHPFYQVETQFNGISFNLKEVVYIPNVWSISNLGGINASSHKAVIDNLYNYIRDGRGEKQYAELASVVQANIGKPKEQITKDHVQLNLPIDYVNYITKINVNEGLHQIFQMHHLKSAELRDNGKSIVDIKKELGDPPWEVLNRMLEEAKFPYYTNKPQTYIGDYELKLINKKDSSIVINFSDLSSGEKVLVSLVIWMYNSNQTGRLPKLMLLDEPDAHLHPSITKQFFNVIEKCLVKDFGVRVILTTHSPSTIAIVEEKYLFEMAPGNPRIAKLQSKDYGINLLTEGIITIRANTKYVLVEDKDDAKYYNEVFKIFKTYDLLNRNIDIVFIPSSNSSAKTSGGCTVVRHWVEKFVNEGADDIFQGLMDYDNGTNIPEVITLTKNLHVVKRYSLENYLLDPVLVYASSLHENKILTITGIAPFQQKDEYRVSKLSSGDLQIIADFIFKEVEPLVTGLVASDKATVDTTFTNGIVLKYPKWFLEKRGHTLYGYFKLKFNQAVDYHKLIDTMIRQEFIPADLLEVFKKIQS